MTGSDAVERRIVVRLICMALGASLTQGCQDSTAPALPRRDRVALEMVTGRAAASVDPATGLFRLEYPASPHVSLLSADSLARGEAHMLEVDPFGLGRNLFEHDRGGPIDWGSLHACERATWVESPVGAFPGEAPGVVRRAWGARWNIPLCGRDGTVQLGIGVADNVLDVRADHDTLVFLRTTGGGEDFTGAGVPGRYPYGLPVTPEIAARAVFELTGLRIAEVPSAFNEHDDWGLGELPLCASWRVVTEAPAAVGVEDSVASVRTQVFFVHHAPACFSDSLVVDVAQDDQPASTFVWFPKDTVGNSPEYGIDSASVPLAGPIRFARVAAIRRLSP